MIDGCYWFRISISEEGLKKSATTTCFMVHPPLSKYIFMSPVKKTYFNHIMLCFSKCNGFESMVELDLGGRDVRSLKSLLLDNRKYGVSLPASHAVLGGGEGEGAMKRRKLNVIPDENMNENNIVRTEVDDDRKYVAAANKAFGTDALPKLECFQAKVKAPLLITDSVSLDDFEFTVEFKGPSVFDGMKELVLQHRVELPLSPLFTCLTTSARNKVEIEMGAQ
jgi:hypothetical protein